MELKDKFYRALLTVLGVFLWVSLCFASIKVPGDPSWAEHFDLVNIIVGLLFAAVVSLTVRTINKIDRNQTSLFGKVEKLSKDFYILEGEHRARTQMRKDCSNGIDRSSS